MRSRPLIATSLVGLLVVSPSLAEDTVGTCADAYEQAQRQQQAGHLRAALKSAIACASETCPVILRRECTQWIAPLRTNIPSLSLRVRGRDGCDRTEATIAVDGEVIAAAPDGAAFEVDPGQHVLRVTVDGARPYEERIVAASGERGRQVVVSFAPSDVVCGASTGPVPRTVGGASDTTKRPIPLLTFVLGGVGVVGLGVAGGFGIAGFSKKSELEGCKPACSPSDTDSMRTAFTISDVALGVGVVSLALATVLYWTRPEVRDAR